MMRGDNMRKFALELEKILYELEPEELMKPVEKRLTTVVKIEFIKQGLLKMTNDQLERENVSRVNIWSCR
ncbi:hypothetical protein Q1695_012628 [Nippostrongylus brasiliensis]|nr:hypothetical protein Q1695_012628 [Nippostrongylus brasiliensis]